VRTSAETRPSHGWSTYNKHVSFCRIEVLGNDSPMVGWPAVQTARRSWHAICMVRANLFSVELPGMCGDLNELRGGDRGHSDGLVIHILRIVQCCFGQSKEGTGREEVLQLRRAK
jgi:hypothetical protein